MIVFSINRKPHHTFFRADRWSLRHSRFVTKQNQSMNWFFKFLFFHSRVSVRLGEHKISTDEDCDDLICSDPVQNIPVDKVIRHANFSSITKINDIALLRLKTAADISGRFVKTICLPTTPETQIAAIVQDARDKMTSAGWGKLGSSEESDEMLKAFVPFIDHKNCTKKITGSSFPINSETYLCAGGTKKEIGESGELGRFINLW